VLKKSSITVTKRSSGISSSESPPVFKNLSRSKSKSGLSEFASKSEDDRNEGVGRTFQVPMPIALPTVSELLEEKKGLCGVLKADVFQIYNLNFGTNANIAARVLMTMCKGELPPSISKETPFLLSANEILKLSSPSAQPSPFIGVSRLKQKLGNGIEKISFGIGIPQFYVNCEWSSRIERTRDEHILPVRLS